MTNSQIIKILNEIAAYLEMKEVPFKPRAYEKAARAIEGLSEELSELYRRQGLKALEGIPGIGKHIALKIRELLETGQLKYYEDLKKEIPVAVGELTAIEGLGPKLAKKLYNNLGIRDIKDLERALRLHKISELAGFGEKSERKILKGLEFLKQHSGRFLLGDVMNIAQRIKQELGKVKGVERVEIGGSFRRKKETVGDLDFLAVSSRPEEIMERFVSLKFVNYIYAKGRTKTLVRLSLGIDADLRVVPAASYGAALQYFTGNKDHNIALRKIAEQKGLKLNEYGLFRGRRRIAGETEESIYSALGFKQVPPPEIRMNKGEIPAGIEGKIPQLVPYGSLKGDLQIQTKWSDGANSIEEMALEAMRLGLSYILVTDHSKSLKVAHGLDGRRLILQAREIDKLNKKFASRGFKILKGIEVDILKDGSLDLSHNVLGRLDVVLGAVHSHLNLAMPEQTRRIIKAMQNPYLDIIAHPTGRVLQRRPALNIDIEEIIQTACRTGTVLEIDAYPDRLDIGEPIIRKCVEKGVKMTVDSDAHHIAHMRFLDLGIAQARRGWATKTDILNTLPVDKFLKALPKRRKRL